MISEMEVWSQWFLKIYGVAEHFFRLGKKNIVLLLASGGKNFRQTNL